MNAPELVAALGGRWHGNYGMVCCPVHADRTPSLRIEDSGDGKVLVYCYARCDQGDIVNALRSRGLWDSRADCAPRDPAAVEREREARNLDREQRAKMARVVWKKTTPAAGSPVETYLASRGLGDLDIPCTLRYMAESRHVATGLSLPAMIAAITIWPARAVVGVHRTYLRMDGQGKAPVSPDKMMLGICRSGAVRLASHGRKLVVAEGIETALSILHETGLPTWSVLSASGYVPLVLPDDVREIVIAADNDPPGIKAANDAARKWIADGLTVRIAKPDRPGADFNDMLMDPIE